MDKETDKVCDLCHKIASKRGQLAQLNDEINDIEDHAEQADAEEFMRSQEHDLRIMLMQLQAALTHVKGLS